MHVVTRIFFLLRGLVGQARSGLFANVYCFWGSRARARLKKLHYSAQFIRKYDCILRNIYEKSTKYRYYKTMYTFYCGMGSTRTCTPEKALFECTNYGFLGVPVNESQGSQESQGLPGTGGKLIPGRCTFDGPSFCYFSIFHLLLFSILLLFFHFPLHYTLHSIQHTPTLCLFPFSTATHAALQVSSIRRRCTPTHAGANQQARLSHASK